MLLISTGYRLLLIPINIDSDYSTFVIKSPSGTVS
jgi:hypothetical protein